MSPQVLLPDDVVRKVVEQSPQGVLAIWMRVSRVSARLPNLESKSHSHPVPRHERTAMAWENIRLTGPIRT